MSHAEESASAPPDEGAASAPSDEELASAPDMGCCTIKRPATAGTTYSLKCPLQYYQSWCAWGLRRLRNSLDMA